MSTTTPATRQNGAPSRRQQPPADTGQMERLTAVFTLDEVKFKPQSVKGNRALAVAYIDSRTIQERLDDVLGPEGWEDAYEVCEGGSVKCRLRLKLNGQWVSKEDVGSPSEQSDAGDRLKAAFSDALKRAAVKFGIGRYLYRLPLVWCDYDIARKQFTNRPQLPDWAKPKPGTTVVQNAGKTRTDAPSGGQKPKNDKPVSVRTATETLTVASMNSNDARFGRMCRKMIRTPDTPMYFAASTYSRSRSDRVWPRTIRAVICQMNMPSNSTNNGRLLWKCGDRIAMIRNDGMTSSRLTIHIRTPSIHLPK